MATIKYRRDLALAIGKRHTVELPPRVFRVRLTGLLFETDKAFLLPSAMKGIRGLVDLYQEHPDLAVVVTGHTDRVGDGSYNLGLSDERAQSIAHYLKDEVDGWMKWYQDQPYSAAWGVREDQHMLSAIPDGVGQPCYEGPAHGRLDAPTRDAVKRYQARRGLTVDGVAGQATRRALVTDYMKLDGTTLPATARIERLGCGESHHEIPTADGVDEPKNRRVEVFLFDSPPADPPVPARCPGGGCPYEEWRRRAAETYDFEHDICELLVECRRDDSDDPADEKDPSPIAGVDVRLSREGIADRRGATGEDGTVWFKDLLPGRYGVLASKAGYGDKPGQVEVRSGGIAPDEKHDRGAKSLVGGPSTTPASLGMAHLPMQLKVDDIIVDLEDMAPLDGTPGDSRWTKTFVPIDFDDGRGHGGWADKKGRLVYKSPHKPEAKISRAEAGVPGNPRVQGQWDIQNSPVTVKSTTNPNQLVVNGRQRLSMYVGGFLSDNQRNFDPRRLWSATDSGFAGVLDDITLIRTVENEESGDTIRFRGVTKLWPESELVRYYQSFIMECHAKGVQVIAGFAMSSQFENVAVMKDGEPEKDEAGHPKFKKEYHDDPQKRDNLKRIVNDAARRETVAANIIEFLWKTHGLDFDGINFDVEMEDWGTKSVTTADLTDFYARVYDHLMKDAGGTRVRLLGVANGAYVAISGSDKLQVPGGGGARGDMMDSMQTQRYEIARNRPNVIMRPMAYGPHPLSVAEFEAWHKEAVEFAIDAGGLSFGQFQLGLAVGSSFAKKGELDSAVIADRCRKICRRNHVGLIVFAHSAAPGSAHGTPWDVYKKYDQALNPQGPMAGTIHSPVPVNPGVEVRVGYPIQVPNDRPL